MLERISDSEAAFRIYPRDDLNFGGAVVSLAHAAQCGSRF